MANEKEDLAGTKLAILVVGLAGWILLIGYVFITGLLSALLAGW